MLTIVLAMFVSTKTFKEMKTKVDLVLKFLILPGRKKFKKTEKS